MDEQRAAENGQKTLRLYHDLAWLWPLLSPPEDYQAEARTICRILAEHFGSRRLRLLELGAGGGHWVHHVHRHHEVTAVDLSEAMLANCRRLNPGVETLVGDMRTLRLGRTFDAVLIHDAIDYMLSEADLADTMATVAAHLPPHGLALIAPTVLAENFTDHETETDHHDNDHVDLTYFTYVHDPDPHDTVYEMILLYLVRRLDASNPTRAVQVIEDRHTMGLFPLETWLRLMDEAGFDVHQDNLFSGGEGGDPNETPLFVGRKR